MSAAAAGLTPPIERHLVCHDCHLALREPSVGTGENPPALACPRCGSSVHHRKPNSIVRTWALVITALICYVPANLYPVMEVTSLGNTQADTIMSGVLFLLHHDMWPLALVIFVASVFVPLAKILVLILLLVSVQIRSQWRPVDRTRAYRATELVGRWSMVDVYVVTILVALVHLGSLATVAPKLGALFFGTVVVVTILAAESFDPRLIWDRMESDPGATAAAAGRVSGGIDG